MVNPRGDRLGTPSPGKYVQSLHSRAVRGGLGLQSLENKGLGSGQGMHSSMRAQKVRRGGAADLLFVRG